MRSNLWRFYLLMGVGGLLGEGLLMVLGILLGSIIGRGRGGGGLADLGLAILGALVGIALGAGLGVYLTRWRLGLPASPWRAWAGSGLAIVGLMALAEPLRLNQMAVVLWALLIGLPPVFAVLLSGWVVNRTR
ncbi:hypothetical protein SE15_07985 [Thermanaerothrix daxensis]|uniref:Uncharacterized protein n=1 Tax=Thermanaerothrix daxensis TaxID=869279 RepID=A0A0P6YKW0_9CHLR|nr:hypothetical protein [Thermanaerothrix daxensis]KPL83184.1 hypothetical protein SE15_07985 [Thermanaerothrix daxensis]